MQSSKVLEKKAFLQHYVLNRAEAVKDVSGLSTAVYDAEKAWNEIENKCKSTHRKKLIK